MTIPQNLNCYDSSPTQTKRRDLQCRIYLRPPPERLAEPRALSDLAPQPPLLPPNADDDPLLFGCCSQPLAADELALEVFGFGVLLEFPVRPLPVLL